jgi:hypothetical protein
MKAAKAKARTGITPRPLLELLRLPPPEDYSERRDFEQEMHLAWKQFRAEHPLGLRQDELNFDMEAAGKGERVGVRLARKLFATGKLAPYCDAYYGTDHAKAKAWQSAEPDFGVLAGLLKEHRSDFSLVALERYLSPAEVVRGVLERTCLGRSLMI